MTRYIYLGITLVCIIQQIIYGCNSTRDEIENKFVNKKRLCLSKLRPNNKQIEDMYIEINEKLMTDLNKEAFG